MPVGVANGILHQPLSSPYDGLIQLISATFALWPVIHPSEPGKPLFPVNCNEVLNSLINRLWITSRPVRLVINFDSRKSIGWGTLSECNSLAPLNRYVIALR